MSGAVERPFSAGKHPMNGRQIDALAALCASLSVKHAIPVERTRILSHAEVSPTLGIAQRGKWDISWLPGMPATGNPVSVGDQIRSRIRDKISMSGTLIKPSAPVRKTVRFGDRGDDVRALQRALALTQDGIFGRMTDAALRDFQADHGLTADGIAGPKTWAIIDKKGY